MPADSKRAAELARWTPRLQDRSRDVRKEATEVIAVIANDERTPLRKEALSALAARLRQIVSPTAGGSDDDEDADDSSIGEYELYYAVSAIEKLSGGILFSHDALWKEFIAVPTKDADVTGCIMETLWRAIERDVLFPDSPKAADLVSMTQAALKRKHRGGRKYALKILDWAQDNGLEPTLTEPKPTVERGAA